MAVVLCILQVCNQASLTQTQYDTAGRPTDVIGAVVSDGFGNSASPVTHTVYDAAGNVASTIRTVSGGSTPIQQQTDFVYDARNRKVQELEPAVRDADPASATFNTLVRPSLVWEYDEAGRATTAFDARGYETDSVYDAGNRVVEVYQPAVQLNGSWAQPVTESSYDLDGNVVTVRDANHHTTTNSYDLLNRLTSTTDAAGDIVYNAYDPVGNKTSVEDADGITHVTTFAYDGLNRLLKTTDAAGQYTTFTYDALNKTGRTDALHQATSYAYDSRNRLTGVAYTGRNADNRAYTYDPVGNLTSVTETGNTAANVGYSYDALNRPISETSNGLTHTYSLDLVGNRLQTVYGGTSRTITSVYDAQNRLSTMTESGRVTSYAYDLNGNIVKKTAPNGDTETDVFDALNRATSETAQTGGSVALFSYTYGYDLVGNVLTVAESYPSGLNDRLVTNTYDAINRLQVEAVTGSAPNATTTYAYDPANNRMSKTITGTGATTVNYSYNNLNQLTGYTDNTGRSVALAYDLDGNRTTRTVSGGSDNGTDSYSYDYENRLVGLVKGTGGGGAGTYAYTYDYRTRRVTRDESSAGGSVTSLVFSGGTSVQEYDNGATTPTVEYIRGSDYGGGVGGILYTLRGGTPSYTHANKRGDIVAKTSASGSLTYQAQYEAFGKQVATAGSTLDRQKSNSKDTDPTGLVDEGMRYRDLETGMFINRDPAGFVDGPNLYTYVLQNPWTKFDPEGLQAAESDADADADANEPSPAEVKEADANGVTGPDGKPATAEDLERGKIYEAEHPPGNGPPQMSAAPSSSGSSSSTGNQTPPVTLNLNGPTIDPDLFKDQNGSETTTKNPPPNPYGRNGNPDHQADVANNNAQNPGSGPEPVGNRVPDTVVPPGQTANVRGQQISPEGPSARVIIESERYNKNGQINSAGRGQIRDVRAADPSATIVVTDPADPQREPSVYPPGTQPPPTGRLPKDAPTAVPAPTAQPPPKPTTPAPSTSS